MTFCQVSSDAKFCNKTYTTRILGPASCTYQKANNSRPNRRKDDSSRSILVIVFIVAYVAYLVFDLNIYDLGLVLGKWWIPENAGHACNVQIFNLFFVSSVETKALQ